MKPGTALRTLNYGQALLALGLLSAGVWVLWGWPYAALAVGGLLWVDMIRRGGRSEEKVESSE